MSGGSRIIPSSRLQIGYHIIREDLTIASSDIQHTDFTLKAKTISRTPWDSNDTPEGLLVNLPLPLHW